MTDEKWLDLLDTLQAKFTLERENLEQITTDDLGHEILNKIERAIFQNDLGQFKLERITRPTIIDKKVHYSHANGTKGLVEYILSPTEKTSKFTYSRRQGRSGKSLTCQLEV